MKCPLCHQEYEPDDIEENPSAIYDTTYPTELVLLQQKIEAKS